jgi:rod shape-determining protein MreD
MKNLVAIPVLVLALMIQTAVISRITLLSGAADLVLLILVAWALQEQVESAWHWAILAGLLVGFVSAVPPIVPVVGYLIAVAFARFIIRQIWQTPILALFSVTFFSTLVYHFVTYVVLLIVGTPLPFEDVLALIVIPSVFLNLFLSIPVHSLLRDLAFWVYPLEELI